MRVDHDVRVRFFTPTTEVPSCGHATIAAHYIRALEEKLPASTVVQKIGAGILPIDVTPEGADYRIVMTQGPPEFSPPLSSDYRDRILNALGLDSADLDDRTPVQVVSTGHSKVLIGLRSIARLDQISPDLASLSRISAEIRCNGYYLFVIANDIPMVAHARMFAPAIGISEDPVRNGAGPLGAYIVAHRLAATNAEPFPLVVRQGEAIGRPGQVDVCVDRAESIPLTVRVSGRAVVVFQSELVI